MFCENLDSWQPWNGDHHDDVVNEILTILETDFENTGYTQVPRRGGDQPHHGEKNKVIICISDIRLVPNGRNILVMFFFFNLLNML